MMFKGHKAVIISEILAVYVDLNCVNGGGLQNAKDIHQPMKSLKYRSTVVRIFSLDSWDNLATG